MEQPTWEDGQTEIRRTCMQLDDTTDKKSRVIRKKNQKLIRREQLVGRKCTSFSALTRTYLFGWANSGGQSGSESESGSETSILSTVLLLYFEHHRCLCPRVSVNRVYVQWSAIKLKR